jgi:ABC-type histidine transport system ATPase subunit
MAGAIVASVQDIRKTYYMGSLSVEVLHGISLDFYCGDYISIMGQQTRLSASATAIVFLMLSLGSAKMANNPLLGDAVMRSSPDCAFADV